MGRRGRGGGDEEGRGVGGEERGREEGLCHQHRASRHGLHYTSTHVKFLLPLAMQDLISPSCPSFHRPCRDYANPHGHMFCSVIVEAAHKVSLQCQGQWNRRKHAVYRITHSRCMFYACALSLHHCHPRRQQRGRLCDHAGIMGPAGPLLWIMQVSQLHTFP